MAVLIEAVTLVVKRRALDELYPGGSEQFIADRLTDSPRLLWVIGDGHLIAISSLADHGDYTLPDIAEALIARGIRDADAISGEFLDFAFVDQLDGVARPCSWLTFQRDRSGVPSVRYIPDGSLDLIAPVGWNPEDAATLNDPDAIGSVDDPFQGDVENRVRHWLNPDMGQHRRDKDGSGQVPQTEEHLIANDPSELVRVVADELRRREWQFVTDEALGVITLTVDCGPLLQLPLRVSVHDADFAIRMFVFVPGHVRELRRGLAAEYLTRINYGLWSGNFDMDWSDGEVVFRAMLTPVSDDGASHVLELLIDYALDVVRKFAGGLLRVDQGESPVAVIRDIERRSDEMPPEP